MIFDFFCAQFQFFSCPTPFLFLGPFTFASFCIAYSFWLQLSFDSVRALEIHDVARATSCSMCTRDAQQQWARTSLTFLKRHQITIGLIEDFSRNSVNISDCRAFSLFETVTGSRIYKDHCDFVVCTSFRIRPLQIHNNFQNHLAIPNKHNASSHQVQKKLSVAIC